MRFGTILAAGGLGGCVIGIPTLDPDFEETLVDQGGCGDLFAYAVDADDEILLTVALEGGIGAAEAAGGSLGYPLPDDGAEVTVNVGSKISDAICDDVIENGGPDVRETWTAVSGTVTLTVDPEDYGAIADVVLEDVVFESPSGEQVTVERYDLVGLSVGWLPG